MIDTNFVRAKAADDGRWVIGEAHLMATRPHIHISPLEKVDINPDTLCRYTGWRDRHNKPIFEGDILVHVIPDGTSRLFSVVWKQQLRHLKPLENFVDDNNPVEISGWCFQWGSHYLLPSYIGHQPDYNRMEIVGNIYDNADLLTCDLAGVPAFEGKRDLIGNTCCISNKPGIQVFMYDLKDEHGNWLARVILTSEGLFMTYSEWGNFFHYFNAPGKDGIRKFMLNIYDDYFAGKLCEVEWNTSTTKLRTAAKRYVKHVLPVLKVAIEEQLKKEE